ncbi:acetolactate synthase AlsS [Mycolicibacterium sp. CH28]|nr:acetolactate synthase AlsS [Mycolicibacterium sp. CH28]
MSTPTDRSAGPKGDDVDTPRRSAQRVVDTLSAFGVRYIFGIPGAKIDAVFDALSDGGPQLVVCRHEQNAGFMAAAVGRLTGIPGVALVTSGPGTTNLATALVTANTEQDPMIAICGSVGRDDRLKRTHQSMNAAALLATVTKYTGEVTHPDNASEAVTNALRAATTVPHGAAAVVIPSDVAAEATTSVIATPAPAPRLGAAALEQISQAGDLIRKARLPLVLVGMRGGDPGACAALRDLLSVTELPVVETFQAAGVVSRTLEEHYLGRVGLFRNQPGDILLDRADVVVTVGFDPVEYDPRLWNSDPARTLVHLDEIAADIDTHYQPTLELRGDIEATVRALQPALAGLTLSESAAAIVDEQRAALAGIDEDAAAYPDSEAGVNPAALVLKIRDLIDDETTVACDIGSNYIYTARHLRAYGPRRLLFSNGQQTLGVALPWAIAAALVRPDSHPVSISGDGGFLFSAQELETATRLGVRFTHVLMRDNTYDMVGFQEKLKYGRESGVQLGDYDIAHYAAAFGATGVRVDNLHDFENAFTQSLENPGITIIDVRVDYRSNTDLAAQLHHGVLD